MTDDTAAPDLDAHYARLNAERRLPRRSPHTLRAAWWALRAVRRARKDLKVQGLQARVAPPPRLPWGSRTGVNGVLSRLSPTCLEGALVRQAWLSAHDIPRDIVVGVKNDTGGAVKAHASVDGVAHPAEYEAYRVIHRIPAR